MPHTSTVRKYYANSELNANPGITKASLQILEKKVAEKRLVGEEVVCSVCFDEMMIRRQATWDVSNKNVAGYVSFGGNDGEDLPVAKEAIVFIVSGLKEKFRIPIAYEFINSLTAEQKTDLVKDVLTRIIRTGVIVSNITFDGHKTNIALCTLLGANLDVYSEDFRPYFHLENKQIFIIYDICHMEKLVRKHLSDKSEFITDSNDIVRWRYIEHLINFAQTKGFSATHKLNQNHLKWRNRPMNVRIAVETLSKSTADSLEYLSLMGHQEFNDSAGTSRFVRLFNDLFDIFNTKFVHDNENKFKNAICDTNKNEIFAFFDEATKYIKSLKFKNKNGSMQLLCSSMVKCGFNGFIINMHSLKMMYEKYVEHEKILSFIPTYFLNQDAVEMFFGQIRSCNGCDDNPDVIRFKAAYRKLLAIDSVFQSRKGNCQAYQINSDPFSDILYVSSRRDITTSKPQTENDIEDEDVVLEDIENLYQKIADLNGAAESHLTDDLLTFSIAQIANIIEDKIKTSDTCEHCVAVFDTCARIDESLFRQIFTKRPCKSTYTICREVERFMKLELLKGNVKFNTIYYAVLNNIQIEQMFNECDFRLHSSHKLYLIRAVVDGYVRLKGNYLAKEATRKMHPTNLRYIYKKNIHFLGK